MTDRPSPAQRLSRLIAEHPGPLVMPCCFDGLSAHLIEAAGIDPLRRKTAMS